MWLAVRADRGKRRTIQASDLIPVRLTLITEEEIAILDDPALKTQARATRRCRQHRLVRMYFEAYGQGGVLTVLDLSLILGVSQKVICGHIHTYEQETEQIVPIRAVKGRVGFPGLGSPTCPRPLCCLPPVDHASHRRSTPLMIGSFAR